MKDLKKQTPGNVIRTDIETGKKYFLNNIPVGRLNAVTLPNGTELKIFPEDGTGAAWYNNRFIGDRYAVFVKCSGVWQQVSNWYYRYGNAVNYMTNYKPIRQEEYTRTYCKEHGIRYKITGPYTDQLFIYSPYIKHYMQVCFSIYNLTNNQIRIAIENHIAKYGK